MNFLLGHVIEDICSLVQWNINSVCTFNLLDKWLNTTIKIKLIVIEEKWVLSIEPKSLGFNIVSPIFWIIEICGFKMMSCFLIPFWMVISALE